MDINSLPDDLATLKGLLADMAASQADQQQHIAQLEQRIRLLTLIIYGPKSEKKPRTGQEQQLSLFDEAEQTVEEQTPQTFEEVCTPTHTRGKRGRRPIPADLPEPLRTVAKASFAHRMVTHVSEHVRDEYHFWSGRPGSRRQLAPSPRRVVALQWKEGLQAVRL